MIITREAIMAVTVITHLFVNRWPFGLQLYRSLGGSFFQANLVVPRVIFFSGRNVSDCLLYFIVKICFVNQM